MSPLVDQFVIGGYFFFLFCSLLPKKKYGLTLFIADISTLVLISFVEVLFVFNFIIQYRFTIYYILQFDPYYFDFYFFTLTLS